MPGERVGGGDNDSYCDSEASLDDGSCYDNLEDVASPAPPDLGHQSLDLRHQDAVSLRVGVPLILSHIQSESYCQDDQVSHHHPLAVPSAHYLQQNPIDKLYLMQDSYFQQ